ncbi:DNA-3-methyladenine glycosylase I [Aestuariibius insulae]|uniref:DNA-3-methyladenine glycosylase I n=1 Tax=Aestuariibius insulae TaxID=2058287 RepID=UPI00345EBD17
MKELVYCDDGMTRCSYRIDDPYFTEYHDTQFGRPTSDDRLIFRKICIEIFAAGLSFHGVLAKMEVMDAAYHRFEIDRVAGFSDADVERLMADEALIRNRRKIDAVINNARCAKGIISEFGSLGAFVWQYEPDPASRPNVIDYKSIEENTQSDYSVRLAKDLKTHGFKFVGPVSMYGVLQGCGLINDHFHGCDFRNACEADRAAFDVPKPK